MNTEKSIKTLNKLLEINNDRIAGYQHAAKEAKENDLKDLFSKMESTSHKFKRELSSELTGLGEKPTDATALSGKVYRAWMDVRAALATNDRKAILKSCEFGEDVAVHAYEDELQNNSNDLSTHQLELLKKQFAVIKREHDGIKNLRDLVIQNS